MMELIKNFCSDEDGAVTVDWVVLTAAVVGLAVAAYSTISTGTTGLTDQTATYLNSQDLSGFQDIQDGSTTTTTTGG